MRFFGEIRIQIFINMHPLITFWAWERELHIRGRILFRIFVSLVVKNPCDPRLKSDLGFSQRNAPWGNDYLKFICWNAEQAKEDISWIVLLHCFDLWHPILLDPSRYQTLAVATDANSKEDIGKKKVAGKRLTVWYNVFRCINGSQILWFLLALLEGKTEGCPKWQWKMKENSALFLFTGTHFQIFVHTFIVHLPMVCASPQKLVLFYGSIRAVYTRVNKPRITQSAAYVSRELSHLYGHSLHKKLVRGLRKQRTSFLCRVYGQFVAYTIRGLLSPV